MTPKGKANELGNKFYRGDIFTHGKEAHLIELEQARKYALIAVDEMINYLISNEITGTLMSYWEEVKQEMEKL